MTFETLPVVHVQGRRFPEYPGAEPDAALTQLARRFGRVVLVDVDGVRANQADLEFVQMMSRRRSLWVDAGSRFSTDAMDLFIAGAEAVTMRWNTLDSAEELEEAAALCQPGGLFLGLEFPGGSFLAHRRDRRSVSEVVELAQSLSVGLVMMVDAEATLRSLPPAMTPRYVQGLPRDASARAQDLGFRGALLAPQEIPEEGA